MFGTVFFYQVIAPIFPNDLSRLLDALYEADILALVQIFENGLDLRILQHFAKQKERLQNKLWCAQQQQQKMFTTYNKPN